MSEFEYNFDLIKGFPNSITVKLHSQVLGGNDALLFNSQLAGIDKNQIKYLLIDLSEVVIMNSSGLGMLVNAHTTLKNHKIKVYLSNANSKIKQLFEMTHLNQVFEMFDSNEEALTKCE